MVEFLKRLMKNIGIARCEKNCEVVYLESCNYVEKASGKALFSNWPTYNRGLIKLNVGTSLND